MLSSLLGALLIAAASAVALDTPRAVRPADLAAADARLRNLHTPANNAMMNDRFRPANSEVKPTAARIISGALPADMPAGAVMKNGPNAQPRFATEQGGWLDGDGMIHCVVLPPPGTAAEPAYSRTWVKTDGFKKRWFELRGSQLAYFVGPGKRASPWRRC